MLLAFEVVLFGGLAFMFFCILRNQDAMMQTMREEHAATLETLQKLEKRIATIQQIEAGIAAGSFPVQQEASKESWSRVMAQDSPPVPHTETSHCERPPFMEGLSLDPLPIEKNVEEEHRGGLPDLKF